MVYLDLDGFKPVNDRHGHGAGDRILAEIGARLAAEAPPGAVMARLGGDEFALVMATTGTEPMVALAHRLVEAVRAPVDLRPGEEVAVGVSAGVAVTADRGCTADALVDAADRALYAAKRAGGGVRVAELSLRGHPLRSVPSSCAGSLPPRPRGRRAGPRLRSRWVGWGRGGPRGG